MYASHSGGSKVHSSLALSAGEIGSSSNRAYALLVVVVVMAAGVNSDEVSVVSATEDGVVEFAIDQDVLAESIVCTPGFGGFAEVALIRGMLESWQETCIKQLPADQRPSIQELIGQLERADRYVTARKQAGTYCADCCVSTFQFKTGGSAKVKIVQLQCDCVCSGAATIPSPSESEII